MTRDGAPLARSPLRLAGVGAALAAALLTLSVVRSDARDRRELARRVAELGASPDVLERLDARLARERDPGELRIAAARLLLARDFPTLRPEPAAALAVRLALARDLAAEALAMLPASWEAALVAGAATFERRLAEQDTRLYSAARDWEAPLAAAAARSGGAPEIEQALARAYLEVWPALSPAKRPAVEALLRRSFADPEFRRRSFERWLAIAGSPAAAESLLPRDAATWELLAGAAWSRGELAASLAYGVRQRKALAAELAARVDAALRDPARLPNGLDAELSAVVAAAPLGRDFAAVVGRAARERPPGPARPALAEAAARWIAWGWPLCLSGDCPLDEAAFSRLASAATRRLAGADAAIAALVGGDEARAERLARRSDALWSEEWGPYLLLAAQRRLAAGDVAAARARLAEAHPSVRSRPAWRALAADAGVSAPGEAADSAPPWQPTAWRDEVGMPTLELEAPRAAAAVVLRLHRPPPRDTLLVAEWDGEVLPPRIVAAGSEAVRLPIAVAPGVHRLRLRALGDGLPELGVTTLE